MDSMIRELTCVECPTGCKVTVSVEAGKAVHLEGFGCRRGRDYAIAEVEHPERLLTTTVPVSGFSVRMLPVRTSRPIPRAMRTQALAEIRKVTVRRAVQVGDVIIANLLGLGVDVIATRAIGQTETHPA
jgi:CxxC motif-containing protein